MPGTRVRPGGRCAAASASPAGVSWSGSARTSTPPATAWSTTAAGASGPSETELWECRSMRIAPIIGQRPSPDRFEHLGQERGRRPEGKGGKGADVAGVAQVADGVDLAHEHPGVSRAEDEPQPLRHRLPDVEGALRSRVDAPQRDLVAVVADLGVRRVAVAPRSRTGAADPR